MRDFMALRVRDQLLRTQVTRLGVDRKGVGAASDETPVLHRTYGTALLRIRSAEERLLTCVEVVCDERVQLRERILDVEHLFVQRERLLLHVQRKCNLVDQVLRS